MAATAPSTVTIRVLLFASYADRLGGESLDLALPAPVTIGDVVTRLRSLPGGGELPVRPLCALNLMHAGPETTVLPGDEVAILPPLAGG
jgi:molybdopterin converting factor small subunit